jgi:hypothetical protein
MPHQAVRAGRDELVSGVRLASQKEPDLAHAEQIEVIDEERGDEHEPPSEREEAV